jgi:hypothetical protein
MAVEDPTTCVPPATIAGGPAVASVVPGELMTEETLVPMAAMSLASGAWMKSTPTPWDRAAPPPVDAS